MKSIALILGLSITIVSFAQKEAYLEAIEKNTIESFNDFLNRYPDSKYKNKILAKLTVFEQPAYLDAVNKNTIEGYEKFLSDFPMSTRRKAIQNKLEMIAYFSIQFSINLKKLREYSTRYPDSKYCESVNERIEFLNILNSNNVDELQSYFESNPTGEYKSAIESKLLYYNLIPKIEEKEQLYDVSDIQAIIKAYIFDDTKLSGKDIISRFEITQFTEIVWKSYTRLVITINTIYTNESLLNKELRNGQKIMIANCYYEVLENFHFAKKLLTNEKDIEVQNFANKVLLTLVYGESFFEDYSKINELDLYNLVFNTVYEDSEVDLLSLNIPNDNMLDNQFAEFEENIVFWFNLVKN